MVELQEQYGDHADFLTIYIKEAHPEDEWQMDANVDQGVCYMQPKSMDDRLAQNGDMSQDPTFGYESWQRPWPHAPGTMPPS